MAFDNRDSLDLGSMEIHRLFRKIFLPTLLGMIFNVAFVLTDGIFIGHGVGPDGLASVNLVSPVMMIITGIGMMFGIGGSVVAAIHLSNNNTKAARINTTQAMVAAFVFAILFSAVLYAAPELSLKWLGTSPHLMCMAKEYLLWFVPTCVFIMIQIVGEFSIRLDGSPKYAMFCAIVPALLNMLLDYVFIIRMGWGLMGAAFATDLGTGVGAAMTLWYFLGPSKTLRFYSLKFSATSMRLFLRNVGYMMKVGFSGFIGEFSLSVMALCGNLAFGKYLGDMGIAAFCVICYLFPIVCNILYAVSSSAQPIISFNYGAKQTKRVRDTLFYGMSIAVMFSLTVTLAMWWLAPEVISVFIEKGTESFGYAVFGLPLFALGFVPNGFNSLAIGYLQSVEANRNSTLLMSLKGIFLPIVLFKVLPMLWGETGLWIAIPLAELSTAVFSILLLRKTSFRKE